MYRDHVYMGKRVNPELKLTITYVEPFIRGFFNIRENLIREKCQTPSVTERTDTSIYFTIPV